MADFSDVSEVEAALTRLSRREDGPFVTQLAREPGRRDSRWAHLFSGPVEGGGAERHSGDARTDDAAHAAGVRATATAGELRSAIATPETAFPDMRQEDRLERLEDEVRALRAELNDLKSRLGG
jgi:hypothetical protein